LGKNGKRIVSFYWQGVIHVYFSEERFKGGSSERDILVNELKNRNFLNQDFDISKVASSRNLNRRIDELRDEEFDSLLYIFEKYCC
jgi:hypothetical protein